MSDAVKKAKMIAKEGDIVLLAPACASFDMFDNYEKRGDAFINAVEAKLS
jgi:UDP-N-acetylmuramoylalanine--D-glutamate ligase